MKLIFASILLLLSGPAFGLDKCFTGSWYEPATSGQGVNLEVTEDLVLGYFYTYDADKQFYLFVGPNKEDEFGGLELTAYETVGSSPFPKEELMVGNVWINAFDSGKLSFSWNFELDADKWAGSGIPWCLGCDGSLELVRLTNPLGCTP